MDTTTRKAAPGTPIIIGVGVLVVVALIVAVVFAGGNVRNYAPGSPEAAAQEYIQALFDGDVQAAHALLVPDLQARCEPDELTTWSYESGDVATFGDVTVTEDDAHIEVHISSTDYGPDPFPFDSYDYQRQTVLELTRIDGQWLVTDAPWPLGNCSRR